MKVNQRGFIVLLPLLAILAVGSVVATLVVSKSLRSKSERIVQSENQTVSQPQPSGEVAGDSATAPQAQATNPIKSSPTPTPTPKESNQPSNQTDGQSAGNQPANQSNPTQSQNTQEQQSTPPPANTPTPSPISNCEQGKPCISEVGDNVSVDTTVKEVCNVDDGITTCVQVENPQTPVVIQDNSQVIQNCLGGGCN